jgi:hypothetical protein
MSVRRNLISGLTEALSDELHEELSNERTALVSTSHGVVEIRGDVWSLQELKLALTGAEDDGPATIARRPRKTPADQFWWRQPTKHLRGFAQKLLYIADIRDTAAAAGADNL